MVNIIKNSIGIKDLMAHYGVEIQYGDKCKCPFHSDKTASLKVYANNNKWYCFGCNQNGDTIDFVSKLFSIDFRTAMQKINDDFGLNVNINTPIDKADLKKIKSIKHDKLVAEKKFQVLHNDLCEELREWKNSESLLRPRKLEDLEKVDVMEGWKVCLMKIYNLECELEVIEI